MATADWCAREAAKATDAKIKTELLKLREAYIAQADAEVQALAERITDIPAPPRRGRLSEDRA